MLVKQIHHQNFNLHCFWESTVCDSQSYINLLQLHDSIFKHTLSLFSSSLQIITCCDTVLAACKSRLPTITWIGSFRSLAAKLRTPSGQVALKNILLLLIHVQNVIKHHINLSYMGLENCTFLTGSIHTIYPLQDYYYSFIISHLDEKLTIQTGISHFICKQ